MERANRIEIFKSMMQCLDDPEIPEKLEEWAFLWNLLGALWTQDNKPELIDLPFSERNCDE